jgi:hypothetical protein
MTPAASVGDGGFMSDKEAEAARLDRLLEEVDTRERETNNGVCIEVAIPDGRLE